jgi:hypothetical protein
VLFVLALGAGGCGADGNTKSGEHTAEHDEHAGEEARGPRGGRLFRAAAVALELSVNDEGPEPVMQAWLYDARMRAVRPWSRSRKLPVSSPSAAWQPTR